MDSQHQGAENEACEKLHCAETKGEGQGDTDKPCTPTLGFVCQGEPICSFPLVLIRLSVVLLGNIAVGPHSEPLALSAEPTNPEPKTV